MAFPKEERKVVTVTIEDDGALTFLATPEADIFLEQGKTITRRASHVEPVTLLPRLLFHFLRLFGNKNKIAAWTRTWRCLWQVNTKPVGGPVLRMKHKFPEMAQWYANNYPEYGEQEATWGNRQEAIDAEIQFLNRWFAERG